ncbi:unnamed protein product [Rotaria magnacalcarata]
MYFITVAPYTEEEMQTLNIPLEKRDYCAHYFRAVMLCTQQYWPSQYAYCEPERHAWDQCEIKNKIDDAKEYERELRLRRRRLRKEEQTKHNPAHTEETTKIKLLNLKTIRVMDKRLEALVESAIEKFSMLGVDIKGVLVCDKSGLTLTSKDVTVSPGPIACLADLAASLSGRRTTICLEHNENQVLIHQADKAVVAVFTNNAT